MAYIGNSPVQDETVTSAQIVDGAIVDADVNSSAAIAFSKMANLTASRLLVSDGSGDVSVSNVTSAEALLLDGGTSATSTTLAAADRLIVNDNGTIVQVALSDFETFFEGAIDTLSSAMTFSSTVTVGSDGSGQDVIFYSGTSGDNLTWDSSEECLTITGTDGAQALKVADGDLVVVDKLYIYDNDGGEYISGDGTDLTITSGNDIKLAVGAAGSVHSGGVGGTSNTVLGVDAGIGLEAGSNYNVLIGDLTGDASMDNAAENVAIGYQSMSALTTGDENTAVGRSALSSLTTGSANVAIGKYAANDLTTCSYNIVIGRNAMENATTSADGNIAIGSSCMSGSWTTADVNSCVSIGSDAMGGALTSAASNTIAIGKSALAALTSGTENTAVGYQALLGHVGGDKNTAIGYGAMDGTGAGTVQDSDNNIAIGYNAMGGTWANDKCENNIAIGNYSMDGTMDNSGSNVAIGHSSLSGNMDGCNQNVAIGQSAGGVLTAGDNNVLIGYAAGDAMTNNGDNVAVGHNALGAMDGDEHYNVAIGYGAGRAINQANADENVIIGYEAGVGGNGGALSKCVIIGTNALNSSDTATHSGSVVIGFNAGTAINSNDASGSVLIGQECGLAITDGQRTTALGFEAGKAITTGNDNTFIGYQAGDSGVDSNGCCIVGQGSDIASDANYANVFGQNITGGATQQSYVGAGSNYATYNHSTSSASWGSTSDVRIKKDINDIDLGLDFINKIRPVKYKERPKKDWPQEFLSTAGGEDLNKESPEEFVGFIAQEIKEVMDEYDTTFSGWESGDNNKGRQSLQYERFVVPLVKAVQELSTELEELKKKVG